MRRGEEKKDQPNQGNLAFLTSFNIRICRYLINQSRWAHDSLKTCYVIRFQDFWTRQEIMPHNTHGFFSKWSCCFAYECTLKWPSFEAQIQLSWIFFCLKDNWKSRLFFILFSIISAINLSKFGLQSLVVPMPRHCHLYTFSKFRP